MSPLIIRIFTCVIVVLALVGIFSACDSVLRSNTEVITLAEPSEDLSSNFSPTATSTNDITEITELETDSTLTELTVEKSEGMNFETLCTYLKQYKALKVLNVNGILLTSDEYNTLCEINPEVDIIATVTFESLTLDLSADEIDISNSVITDNEAFKNLLAHFPSGLKLIMCDCGFTDAEMGALREAYPHISFVWRIYLGKWNIRTDDEAFSVMIYDDNYTRLTSEDLDVLKYCTNMYALDLGHQAITDLTVIGEMTDLRVLILADNKITDLTPLSNLKNLQYLELFVNRISDLSPLAECTELVDLNFGWNSVWDLSCIYSLPKIERLWLPTNPVGADKHGEISSVFPNAQIVFEDVNSISSGWRTHERYFSMRGMFTNNKYDVNFVK